MEFFFYISFLVLFFCFLEYFEKKLLVLLFLEMMSLIVIFYYYSYYSSVCLNFFVPFLFSLLMVLDSVFGICLIVTSGRNMGLKTIGFNFC